MPPHKIRISLVVAFLLCGIVPCAFAKPLKVFILAGQPNMQGHMNVSTFDSMESCWPKVDAKAAEEKDTSWDNKMKHMAKNFTAVEWKRMKGVPNGGYHYLGAAKIMAPIGKAFAEANLQALR